MNLTMNEIFRTKKCSSVSRGVDLLLLLTALTKISIKLYVLFLNAN